MVSERSRAQARVGSGDADEHRVKRLMIALKGHREVKYPLYKQDMTIGRSAGSDIQIDADTE